MGAATAWVVLVILALMMWFLKPLERRSSAYGWTAAALLVTGLLRANQPAFTWTHWESLYTFDLIRNVTLTPLALGAWMMAWRGWFRLDRPTWIPGITICLLHNSQLRARSWKFYSSNPSCS